MKRVTTLLVLLLALVSPVSVRAEAPSSAPDDPLARYLFPPDRVMDHSREIGLDDGQFATIRAEVQKAQPKFLDLQFDAKREAEKLTLLVSEKRVDESKALAAVDRLLGLEKEIKRTQMTLLIRIKNVLTPAQQAKLEELARSGK
jgi:Spy/CpxP family protein refolding chaperone